MNAISLTLIALAAVQAPSDAPDWRTAAAVRLDALAEVSFEFRVSGSPELEFLTLEGRYARSRSMDAEYLEARVVQADGRRSTRRHARRGVVYRTWVQSGVDTAGSGRITYEAPQDLRSVWLPREPQLTLFGAPIEHGLDRWSFEVLEPQSEHSSELRLAARDPLAGDGSRRFELRLDSRAPALAHEVGVLYPLEGIVEHVKQLGARGRTPDPVVIGEIAYFPRVRWAALRIEDVGPGVPFVVSAEAWSTLLASGDRFRWDIDTSTLEIGRARGLDLDFAFPDGCLVRDEIAGRDWVEGRPNHESPSELELIESLLHDEARAPGRFEDVRAQCGASIQPSACGANCLFALYAARGQYVPLSELHRLAYEEAPAPGSLQALADALKAFGDHATLARAPLERLEELALPAIVHVLDPERAASADVQAGHYVVLWAVAGSQVLVSDPPELPRWVQRNAITPVWTEAALSFAAPPAASLSKSRALRLGTALVTGLFAAALVLRSGLVPGIRLQRPPRVTARTDRNQEEGP